jgi:hypothetical protein
MIQKVIVEHFHLEIVFMYSASVSTTGTALPVKA